MKVCSFRGHARIEMRQEMSMSGDLGLGLCFTVNSQSAVILALPHCRVSVSPSVK